MVEIDIPPGVEDGESFNYPGLAPGGIDLIVTYKIHPNPRWQRQGLNLFTEAQVNIWTLITGGEISVRDIAGHELTVGIPNRCQPGTMLRCRGRGLAGRQGDKGDLMLKIQAQIPVEISPELMTQIQAEIRR
jgi:DnaJ-class molecular chaperone